MNGKAVAGDGRFEAGDFPALRHELVHALVGLDAAIALITALA